MHKNPSRLRRASRWLLAAAILTAIGLIACGLATLWPDPPPAVSQATVAAPQPIAATSAPATPTEPPTSPLVERRDWPSLARIFDTQAALADIEWLCSAERAGRLAGSANGREVAEWIAARFAALGLEPAGDEGSYLQEFSVPLAELTAMPTLTLTRTDGQEFHARLVDDFMPWSASHMGPGLAEGPLVWANHGSARDLEGVDIEGAIVVLRYPVSGEAYARLVAAGAAGLLTLFEDAEAVQMGRVAREPSVVARTTPAAYIGPDVVSFMLATSGHTLSSLSNAPSAVRLPGRARFEVAMRQEPAARAQNVLAVLPGRSDEVVVLGAHYDHLGRLPDGTYYPGANDNASGVAALLEIARSWQEAGFVPERTVLFAAWDGEEGGLFGSRHYVEHPAFPLERTVAMLQLDMVGASPRPVLLLDGDGLVAEHTLAAAAELGVAVELSNVGRSDHASFREAGIPASMYIWPALDAGDYHRPSDTPETISPDLLRQAGSLAALVALRLSMDEPVPELPAGEVVRTPVGAPH